MSAGGLGEGGAGAGQLHIIDVALTAAAIGDQVLIVCGGDGLRRARGDPVIAAAVGDLGDVSLPALGAAASRPMVSARSVMANCGLMIA